MRRVLDGEKAWSASYCAMLERATSTDLGGSAPEACAAGVREGGLKEKECGGTILRGGLASV